MIQNPQDTKNKIDKFNYIKNFIKIVKIVSIYKNTVLCTENFIMRVDLVNVLPMIFFKSA